MSYLGAEELSEYRVAKFPVAAALTVILSNILGRDQE